MPKSQDLALLIRFFVIPVRAVSTTTFTAIPSFQMVLFGKDLVPFL